MELSYSKAQVPYGIVALHKALKNAPAMTITTPPSDGADTASPPCLTISGTDTSPATRLTGTPAIMRYLARCTSDTPPLSQSPVYPEHNVAMCAEVDAWLSRTDQCATQEAVNELVQSIEAGSPYVVKGCEAPTVADYACWSAVQQHPQQKADSTWLSAMNAREECKHALAMFPSDQSVTTPESSTTAETLMDARYPCNVIIPFRRSIAKELARVTGFKDEATIKTFIEFMKGSNSSLADMCVAVPRFRLPGNPVKLAEELCAKINTNEHIARVSCGGPFINFFLRHETLKQMLLPTIAQHARDYGTNLSGAGKTVIVEFSSPNIAKPFHAGHLRSTILGNFVRNVCKANGMKTVAINYLGDWGKQYGLLAVGFEKYGSEEQLLQDPIRHLFEVYVRISAEAKDQPEVHDVARAYFKKMEDGDEQALGLWRKFRALSIEKYREIYDRLNIEFDIYSGESEYSEGMVRVMAHLRDKKLLQESQGALIVDLQPYKMIPAVIQKGDGATLYITRDIAAAWERQETHKFDQMYYTVGAQQDLHFQQLFKILELSGFEWAKRCAHINFGMVRGMSTRRGDVVFLEDILDEAHQVMHTVMQRNPEKYAQIEQPEVIADIIGLSAVVVQDMGAKRLKDYDFDWNRMTSFEGDTGPYLQYSHARLCSIERKYLSSLPEANGVPVRDNPVQPPFPFDPALVAHMSHPKFDSICLSLAQYPDLVAAIPNRNFEACNVVTYLMDLCHKVSTAYEELYVSGQQGDVARARYWVYWSAKTTLANGMRLLGLRPVERM